MVLLSLGGLAALALAVSLWEAREAVALFAGAATIIAITQAIF